MPLIRNIFLDTQVFKTNNFNFESKPLQLLNRRAADHRVSVYITDVVDREVRARVRREVEESKTWYNRLRREARILLSAKGTPFHGLAKSLDADAAVESILEDWEVFLEEAEITIIKCGDVRAETILDQYFNQKPPFNFGEKRKEFSDAISIAAVETHFKNQETYVISGDGDIRGACAGKERLHPLVTLDEYLTLELADHEDVGWIADALEEQSEEIRRVISKAFSDGYFYLDDQDGEVAELSVNEISVLNIDLLDVSDFDGQATVDCYIEFAAEISYEDPNSVIYDEGEKYSFGTIDESVEREERDSFSVTFDVDRVAKTIDNISCSDTKSRSFSAVVYDDYK
jgi:hypothetical protein